MITSDQVSDVTGALVHGTDDVEIGPVGQVYLDDETGQPSWVTVRTGLFGDEESFVPLAQAALVGGVVRVPFVRDLVGGAPRLGADGHLEPEQEQELHRYYDLEQRSAAGTEVGAGTGLAADPAMTRSEESLVVGTEVRESGRARLRKHVVTERQTVVVPVSHEELRVEREPVTEAEAAALVDAPTLSEAEHVIVLHEEVPLVGKEVRAVERVRVETEAVVEEHEVSGEVRKELVELETDGTARSADPLVVDPLDGGAR